MSWSRTPLPKRPARRASATDGRRRWAFRRERLRLPNGTTLGGEALARDPWQGKVWEIFDSATYAFLCGTRGVAKTTTAAAFAIERCALRRDFRAIVVANDGDQAQLLHEAAAGVHIIEATT